MPSRASKKRTADPNKSAFDVLQHVIRKTEAAEPQSEPTPAQLRSAAATVLSKLGASKGGKARAKALSSAERSEIARKAARTRWKPKPKR